MQYPPLGITEVKRNLKPSDATWLKEYFAFDVPEDVKAYVKDSWLYMSYFENESVPPGILYSAERNKQLWLWHDGKWNKA